MEATRCLHQLRHQSAMWMPCRLLCSAAGVRKPRGHWESAANRIQFLEQLAKDMQIAEAKDWRKVTVADVRGRGGAGLLSRYNNSIAGMLQDVFRKEDLDAAVCRPCVPNGHWDDRENQVAFLRRLAEAKGITETEQWRSVTLTDVAEAGGRGLLKRYNDSVFALLQDLVPDFDASETPWTVRKKVPNGYWEKAEHRRAFMDHVAGKMGVVSPSDWLRVKGSEVAALGGRGLLARYSGSLALALADVYPELESDALEAMKAPTGLWDSRDARRAFLDEVAAAYAVRDAADWAKVTTKDVVSMGGAGLLSRYSSFNEALEDLFPEYGAGAVSSARRAARGSWASATKQRAFLDSLANKFNVKEPRDWVRVTNQDVVDHGGASLLKRHSSFLAALKALYPEFRREEWHAMHCRPTVPTGHWESEENVRQFLQAARVQLGVTCDADWARVSHKQIRDIGGGSLIARMPLKGALDIAYPGKNWDSMLQSGVRKAAQRNLHAVVRNVFA